jgi:hypothetical protein
VQIGAQFQAMCTGAFGGDSSLQGIHRNFE